MSSVCLQELSKRYFLNHCFRYNESARVRMRTLREKRRKDGLNDSLKSLTRTSANERRKIWRDAKRRQTEKMSDEKKQMLLAKRRERYLEKKMNAQKTINVPSSPRKYARMVLALVKNASPEKKKCFAEEGIQLCNRRSELVDSLRSRVKILKASRVSKDRDELGVIIKAIDCQDDTVRKQLGVR